MRPSTAMDAPAAARPRTPETTRFRCGCGRSVAAQAGSDAAETGRCSTCRARQHAALASSLVRA